MARLMQDLHTRLILKIETFSLVRFWIDDQLLLILDMQPNVSCTQSDRLLFLAEAPFRFGEDTDRLRLLPASATIDFDAGAFP